MSKRVRELFDKVTLAASPEGAIPDNVPLMELAEMVVRGKVKLSAQQQRMLIELLPFIAPKLSAVANVNGQDFASLLDRRLERIAKRGPRLLEDLRFKREPEPFYDQG